MTSYDDVRNAKTEYYAVMFRYLEATGWKL